jgi:hypothetical protein
LAASFSGGGARSYEYGPPFVPGEICRLYRSSGEKFLHHVGIHLPYLPFPYTVLFEFLVNSAFFCMDWWYALYVPYGETIHIEKEKVYMAWQTSAFTFLDCYRSKVTCTIIIENCVMDLRCFGLF